MNGYGLMIACGVGAVLFAVLLHAYFYNPVRELKRRAAHHNPLLRKLVTVSDHRQATLLLLGIPAFSLAIITVIITARTLKPLAAFAAIAIFVGLFVYAHRKTNRMGVWLAGSAAPYLEPLVRRLNPPLVTIGRRLRRRNKPVTTQLYEKDDLKELLRMQKKAINNRISPAELDNALHALDFGSKKVKDYMVKHKDIQFVTTKEPIGPILLSELHKSGFSCFPVQGNSKHEVVGMLHMDDLTQHTSGGLVGAVMDTRVLYVCEDHNLEYVLQAFNQTARRLFVVIDINEKIVGLISVGDVLEQLVGHAINSDFEDYDNPSAVAHG